MNYWLMKSEPQVYSIDSLRADKVTNWNGVRNYQVRNMLRDEIAVGDRVLFYHSNTGPNTGIVGEMKVTSEAKVDKTQFDSKDSHFDPKSTKDNPRWWCVEVAYVNTFPRRISLEEIKSFAVFKNSKLIQKGNRLSIVSLTKQQYQKVVTASKK